MDASPRDWLLVAERIAALRQRLDELSGGLARQLRGAPFEVRGEVERYLVEDSGAFYVVSKRLGTVVGVREVVPQSWTAEQHEAILRDSA